MTTATIFPFTLDGPHGLEDYLREGGELERAVVAFAKRTHAREKKGVAVLAHCPRVRSALLAAVRAHRLVALETDCTFFGGGRGKRRQKRQGLGGRCRGNIVVNTFFGKSSGHALSLPLRIVTHLFGSHVVKAMNEEGKRAI